MTRDEAKKVLRTGDIFSINDSCLVCDVIFVAFEKSGRDMYVLDLITLMPRKWATFERDIFIRR